MINYHEVKLRRACMKEQQKLRVTVEICGQTYTMVGEETKEHMTQVANQVDEQMQLIRQMNPALDRTKLAVLTAVNTVNQQMKLELQMKQLQEELKQLKG